MCQYYIKYIQLLLLFLLLSQHQHTQKQIILVARKRKWVIDTTNVLVPCVNLKIATHVNAALVTLYILVLIYIGKSMVQPSKQNAQLVWILRCKDMVIHYDEVIVIYFTDVAFTCVAIFKLTQGTSTFVVNRSFSVSWN